jgi:hypothetical protein
LYELGAMGDLSEDGMGWCNEKGKPGGAFRDRDVPQSQSPSVPPIGPDRVERIKQ